MAGFSTSADIVNRALQRVGAKRVTALSDNVKNAKEAAFCYDKLRRAELRRNVWRFAVRRAIIRAVGTALQNWSPTLTYSIGAYVTYGSDTLGNPQNYVALTGANTNLQPDTHPSNWAPFYGSTTLLVTFSAWNSGTTYVQGQAATGSDGRVYLALQGSTNKDPTTDAAENWTLYFGTQTASQFDSTLTYQVGEIVFDTTTPAVYSSVINNNGNDPISSGIGWVQQVATVAPIVVPWPAGTGPQTENNTENVYVLPVGFLRQAPQDPSAGRQSTLGFPSNLPVLDWVLEGPYLVSSDPGPIMFRYVADVSDVTMMDDLFCEGLGSRIALELCEPLTQSTSKLTAIGSEYKQFMNDARNVNGIEEGPQPPPLDDYILCRF